MQVHILSIFSILLHFSFQERRKQQINQNLSPEWQIRLCRSVQIQLGDGSDQPLHDQLAGGVQQDPGHQASVPGVSLPSGKPVLTDQKVSTKYKAYSEHWQRQDGLGRRFTAQLGHTKNHKNGKNCLSAWNAGVRVGV